MTRGASLTCGPPVPLAQHRDVRLPPEPALGSLRACADDWSAGRVSWEAWNNTADASRECSARLIGVDHTDVSVGPT